MLRKPNRKELIAFTTALVLIIGAGVVIVKAANPATSDGTFQIDSIPSVSAVDFQTDAYVTTPTLDPDASTWFRVNATISLSSGLQYLHNVTIYVFDDSVHGADVKGGSPDGIQLTVFQWLEASDAWSVQDQGAMSNWAVDSGNSDDPGSASAETEFEFSMRFQISQVARYDVDWNVSVFCYDEDGTPDEGYDSESALVTMNEYYDLSFSSGSFTWGTDIQPSSVNNSITPDTLTITVYANRQWELKIKGTDFTATAESPIDLDVTNIIAWDEDGVVDGNSFWIRNTDTIGLGTWDNQAPMSTEAGISRDVHIYLSVDTVSPAGGKTWTTTITVTLQTNT